MKSEWIATILSIISALSSAGWFFEHRKRRAVVDGVEEENRGKNIENQSKEITLYQSILDDLGSRYEKKFHEITEMYDRKFKILEQEIVLHKRTIRVLKKENSELKNRLKE